MSSGASSVRGCPFTVSLNFTSRPSAGEANPAIPVSRRYSRLASPCRERPATPGRAADWPLATSHVPASPDGFSWLTGEPGQWPVLTPFAVSVRAAGRSRDRSARARDRGAALARARSASSDAARSNSARASSCGRASRAGRRARWGAGDSRGARARRASASTSSSPSAGPEGHRTATARLSSTTGDRRQLHQRVVERDDPLPVGLVAGARTGVACGDRGLERVRARGPRERLGARQRGEPARTSSWSQRDRSWSRSRTGCPPGPTRAREPRSLQLHQRDQAVDLGLVGDELGQDAAEAERVVAELGPHPVVAARSRRSPR